MRFLRRTRLETLALGAALVALSVGAAPAQSADPLAPGRQALEAGRVDEAMAMFEKAVAADPKNPAALSWLGRAQVQKATSVPVFERPGWVRKGFNTLDEAVERFPNAFIVYLLRGITATLVPDLFKKAPLAVRDLSGLIALRAKNPGAVPDSVMPSVYLHLGIAYKKIGQAAEARAVWEKGREAYPGTLEAQTMERALRSL